MVCLEGTSSAIPKQATPNTAYSAERRPFNGAHHTMMLRRVCDLCLEAAEAHVHIPVCAVCLDSHDPACRLHPIQLLRQQHL